MNSKPVLIVEDDPMIAMDLESLVSEAGGTPVSCGTLRDAMAAADAANYAMALLDIDLPDGYSFPLARRLGSRGVPVLFLSAARKADIPAEFRSVAFLPKPYRPAEGKAQVLAVT